MQVNNETKKVILRALKDLRETAEVPDDIICPQGGICCNVYEVLATYFLVSSKSLEELLRSYYPTWPDYSGDPTYPVPGGKEAFNSADASKMWGLDSPYADYRRELLDHLISELSKET